MRLDINRCKCRSLFKCPLTPDSCETIPVRTRRHVVSHTTRQISSHAIPWDSNVAPKSRRRTLIANSGLGGSDPSKVISVVSSFLVVCFLLIPFVISSPSRSSSYFSQLRGLSPRANYTDSATTACWRS
jgi:hypothetical protein